MKAEEFDQKFDANDDDILDDLDLSTVSRSNQTLASLAKRFTHCSLDSLASNHKA